MENEHTFELIDYEDSTYYDYDEEVEVTVRDYTFAAYDTDGTFLGLTHDYDYVSFAAPTSDPYNPLD